MRQFAFFQSKCIPLLLQKGSSLLELALVLSLLVVVSFVSISALLNEINLREDWASQQIACQAFAVAVSGMTTLINPNGDIIPAPEPDLGDVLTSNALKGDDSSQDGAFASSLLELESYDSSCLVATTSINILGNRNALGQALTTVPTELETAAKQMFVQTGCAISNRYFDALYNIDTTKYGAVYGLKQSRQDKGKIITQVNIGAPPPPPTPLPTATQTRTPTVTRRIAGAS